MLEILFLNPRVHLALAIAASVAAAFFWGFVMGRSKGKHEERIHFLSLLLSAKLEELTQTETNKQDNG